MLLIDPAIFSSVQDRPEVLVMLGASLPALPFVAVTKVRPLGANWVPAHLRRSAARSVGLVPQWQVRL